MPPKRLIGAGKMMMTMMIMVMISFDSGMFLMWQMLSPMFDRD